MKKMTFDYIRENGLLLYEYIRGSQVYGTNTPESDEDHGGIFIAPKDQLLGLGLDYVDEVSDAKHDTCWWELGKFMTLLLKSNPTVLEALYIPDDKVIFEHPFMTEIKKHRDCFLTKQAFLPLGGYAVSQIEKARGQNKKIHWDINQMTRKSPLDYVYTFCNQGSKNIQPWLEERGLEQRNIGLVNIPNMEGVYGAYYDFGQHIKLNNITKEYFCSKDNSEDKFITYILDNFAVRGIWDDYRSYERNMESIWEKISIPKGGHCGIISPNKNSNELRYNSHVTFSSVKKGDEPICWVVYNQGAYENHCRKYKEYEEWKKTRNKARYENNLSGLDKNNPELFYDAKNMMHCFRLIAMATEIANGEGMKLDRRGIDADFLLDVRNRKYTYNELMEKLTAKKEEMDEAIKNSTIKDSIDVEFTNNLLLTIRSVFYNTYDAFKYV